MLGDEMDERGTIVIINKAGRALRKKCAAVLAENVLDCSGRFSAGDRVHVTFRGRDGGQYAIATGIVRCDDTMLRLLMVQPADARSNPGECADRIERDPIERDLVVVIREQDLVLLWPSSDVID
jgi:glutamate 5-kinase